MFVPLRVEPIGGGTRVGLTGGGKQKSSDNLKLQLKLRATTADGDAEDQEF